MKFMTILWSWLRWPLLGAAIIFVAYLGWGFYLLHQKTITEQGIAQINSRKLSLADVMGKNLPPMPDQAENDATVAGIDKNNNGIRDDVELAIFKSYPNDAKVRAAELQYAMALQTNITEAFNSETWLFADYQTSRADLCIAGTYPRSNLKEFTKVTNARNKEVESLVFNTTLRQTAREKFASLESNLPYNPPNIPDCDVDLSNL